MVVLLLFVLSLAISNHTSSISIESDICELKQCKSYPEYMRELEGRKKEWEQIKEGEVKITQLDK